MSFLCPIVQRPRAGFDVVWVSTPLTVIGTNGPIEHAFLFDTGCQITTVSEDIAAVLGLPQGGRPVNLHGSTGTGTGRLVDVRFRFPKTVSNTLGLEVTSTWIVTSGQTGVALLGFMEVHRHFYVRTYEFEMYFIPWSVLRGAP